MVNSVAHVKNGPRITIRCDEATKVEFKRVAANLGDYEAAIKVFITAYNKNPELFKQYKRVQDGEVKWV